MNYWWVNQNQTYRHEVQGGYLWSPKTKTDGHKNYFYDTMAKTRPGDVVFSFCDTLIKAVGIVEGPCQSAPKPTEFGSSGAAWAKSGWYVPMRFVELHRPICPKDHIVSLRPLLPARYSPLQENGNGNQGVYLTELPAALSSALVELLQGQVAEVLAGGLTNHELEEAKEQERIINDTSIRETEREQLVKARVGQGIFRSRVSLMETSCRLTGISDGRFLRASHIKPWAKSSNEEKLDGHNGLMLSPHIDHLFDKGFISFDDNGRLLVSPKAPSGVFSAWHLEHDRQTPKLTAQQKLYMQFHRLNIFLVA